MIKTILHGIYEGLKLAQPVIIFTLLILQVDNSIFLKIGCSISILVLIFLMFNWNSFVDVEKQGEHQ